VKMPRNKQALNWTMYNKFKEPIVTLLKQPPKYLPDGSLPKPLYQLNPENYTGIDKRRIQKAIISQKHRIHQLRTNTYIQELSIKNTQLLLANVTLRNINQRLQEKNQELRLDVVSLRKLAKNYRKQINN